MFDLGMLCDIKNPKLSLLETTGKMAHIPLTEMLNPQGTYSIKISFYKNIDKVCFVWMSIISSFKKCIYVNIVENSYFSRDYKIIDHY